MNRAQFLSILSGIPFIGRAFASKPPSVPPVVIPEPPRGDGLDQLVEAFYISVNKIRKYNESEGIGPGAKVECTLHNGDKITGTVSQYGRAWVSITSPMFIPVDFEGFRQPWPIDRIKVIEKQPSREDLHQSKIKAEEDQIKSTWAKYVTSKRVVL